MRNTEFRSSIPPVLEGRSGGFRGVCTGGGAAIFLVGMTVSVLLFVTLNGRVREVHRMEFEREASQVAASLRGRLELPLEVLHSIESLFNASSEVTRSEFRNFVSSALRRHPGIRALEWIPIVSGAERDDAVARARAEGLKDFEFKHVGQDLKLVTTERRSEYLPILYMEPPDPMVLGFDVGSDITRRAPTDRARERNHAVVSERIRLVEDPPTVASIAVFLPVHKTGNPHDPVIGFATAVFRLHQVIEPAIQEALARNIQLVLTDPAARPEARLLFETTPGLFDTTVSKENSDLETQLSYVDRTWKLSFARNRRSSPADAPWMVLGVGFVVSLLLGLAFSALLAIHALRRQVKNALRLGQYTLIEKLGEGGMGAVFRARHALLRRPTAIKLLPPTRRNAHQLARFEREVQMTSRLAHPNTISIYDYGRTPEGIFYYAMEYLDGITLEDLVEQEGALPAGRVLRILDQILGALTEAHGLGLIHRDIKPANIMLTRRGGIPDFVMVLDFGLVKESDSNVNDTGSLSRAMPILGTPLYMSPEAVLSKELDARADLYAVGAVAYYLLCGETVFGGASVVEVCLNHLNTVPTPPSERSRNFVPASLDTIIMKCLEKQPDSRPSSASELQLRLREVARDVPPYSDEHANAFWDARWPTLLVRLAARQQAGADSNPHNSTLAVDPAEREGKGDESGVPMSRRMTQT